MINQHISQHIRQHPSSQLNRKSFILTTATLASTMAIALTLGCTEEPPPVVIAPVAPVKVFEPEIIPVTSIADLMLKFDIDSRVNLAEADAPPTDIERIAVLKFYDCFARGNSESLKGMLSPADQFELDRIVSSGDFKKSTDPITHIDVRCAKQESDMCTLAVFHIGAGFQPQLWAYTAGEDTSTFDAIATPANIMDRLSGDNHIAAWYEIVKLELAKADEPDEVLEVAQQDFTKADAASSESTGGGETAPGAPAGAPGKRAPGAPIKPPKPPGFGTK